MPDLEAALRVLIEATPLSPDQKSRLEAALGAGQEETAPAPAAEAAPAEPVAAEPVAQAEPVNPAPVVEPAPAEPVGEPQNGG